MDTPSVPRNRSSSRRASDLRGHFGRSLLLLLATSLPTWAGEPCADYSVLTPIVGSISPPSGPVQWKGLAYADGFVYVAEQYGDPGFGGHPRLSIVDVTNPAIPVRKGTVDSPTGISPYAIATWKQFAYLAMGFYGVGVIDATQPDTPLWVRTFGPGAISVVEDVTVRPETAPGAGDAHLVMVTTGQTRLYSLTQPGNPTLWSLAVAQGGDLVAVAGDHAYVAYNGTVMVIAITGPGAPSLVTTVTVPEPVSHAVDLSVDGNFLCLASYHSNREGVHVFDISNPGAIAYRGVVETFEVYSVAVHDGAAYAGTLGGVSLVALGSAPPMLQGTFQGGVQAMCAAGNLLYTLTYYNGLRIVDISAPSFIPFLGGLKFRTGSGLAVQGERAFVVNYSGLKSVDVSEPTAPVLLGTLSAPRGDIAIEGGHAYTIESSLQVVDIADPTAMQVVATVPIPGSSETIAVADGFAYLPTAGALQIFDVTVPVQPVLVHSVPIGTGDIAIAEDVAVVTVNEGIAVIDITAPRSAHVVGALPIYGAYAVSLQGSYAYVTGDYRLRVVDLSDPTAPEIVGEVAINTHLGHSVVDDHLVYLAEGYDILLVDVSDLTAPFIAGKAPTPGDSEKLVIANELLYVQGDLLIYPLHCPSVTQVASLAPSSVELQLRIAPNPAAGPIRIELPVGAPIAMSIYDVQGRIVQRWTREALAAGSRVIVWDGRDLSGRRVPAGAYWAKLVDRAGDSRSDRITILR